MNLLNQFSRPSKYILANPEYHFSMTHHAATAFWYNNDLYKNNDADGDTTKEFLNNLFDKMITNGHKNRVIKKLFIRIKRETRLE